MFNDGLDAQREREAFGVRSVEFIAYLHKLKSIRTMVIQDMEKDKKDFAPRFNSLIRNQHGHYLNFRNMFRAEQMDWLLSKCVMDEVVIKYVIKCGYKDEPEMDDDRKPLLNRITPLHYAANYMFSNSRVRQLFEIYDRFDVNYIDDSGCTHFHVACKYGLADIVEKFLEQGLDPNILAPKSVERQIGEDEEDEEEEYGEEDDDDEEEGYAGEDDDDEEEGYAGEDDDDEEEDDDDDDDDDDEKEDEEVEDDKKDKEGLIKQVMPPLHLALALNRRKVVKLLLKNGADPNLATAEGVTPLHLVSWSSDRVAKLFFAINYDKGQTLLINARDKNGNTPLHWALSRGHRTMTKWLLERRLIDPESRNCLGSTPLHMISKRTTEDDTMELFFEMLAVVRKKTVNVDARDERGRTPLHYSLKNCRRRSTKALLMNGADPNATDAEGSTALHLICKRKYSFTHETAEVFFDVNDEMGQTVLIDARDKKGRTPLHIALFCKHEDMIQVLLKNGADPNLANEEGLTPLHIISKRDEDDGLMKLFFEIIDDVRKTVQVDAVDNSGHTPLQWAVASLLPSTIDVLLDNGANLSRLNFTFPTVGHFDEKYKLRNRNRTIWFKLKFAYDTMAVVEQLEKRGYELDRSGAMTIMNAFDKHELFKRPANFDESRYDDEEFVKKAKEIMIKPSLSLYDLIRLRPEESITLNEMHEFLKTSTYYRFTKIYHDACDPYLCEIPTRRFFQKWAPDCLQELISSANNFKADLWRICLAATGRTEAQSVELIA